MIPLHLKCKKNPHAMPYFTMYYWYQTILLNSPQHNKHELTSKLSISMIYM